MAQTVSWLPLPATTERRSEFVDTPVHPGTVPRSGPSASSSSTSTDFRRWPQGLGSDPSRVSRMSLDFTAPGSHHAPPQAIYGGNMHSQQFDQPETMDVSEHSNYNVFSNSPQSPSFPSSRYRSNNSPSSALSYNYPMSPDNMYPSTPFGESVTQFNSSTSQYDMLQSTPYGSGKVSPLTPNDPAGSMSHSYPALASQKDYAQPSSYPDMLPERRLGSGNFQPDFHDEYVNGGNNQMPFSPSGVAPFTRYQDNRFPHSPTAPATVPSHMHHGSDTLRSIHPHRHEGNGMTGYDEIPHYLAPNPHTDLSLRMPVDETLARLKLHTHSPGGMSSATDLQSFIRPHLDQYVRTHNRLAFGERTVIVMSSKVAQKSYGTEKRFLCPPPTAIMIGTSWWTDVVRHGEEPKLCPPRVVISISGEPSSQEGTVDWTSSSGKSFDVSDPPTGTTYIGRCVGKQLFISDMDEKKRKVEALVKIIAPASDNEMERVIGTFQSRPIKVISKPSKKRQSAKNLELCINHGSTISLFHRLRSQTVSTKYLCVSGSGSSFKGSDGAPLMGLDQRSRSSTPSFIARTASWDPFVMYIVDINKPTAGMELPPTSSPHADYPSPPPNAIPFPPNGSQIPIYYNQTVVLQCLTSGVVSPVLIIRKVDHQTTVVGGGLQEGAKSVAELYCIPGEVCGDPVSQLHKVAFEVYEAHRSNYPPEPGTPGVTGAFLSCMGEKVNTYRPIEGRQWNTNNTSPLNGSPDPGSPIVSATASSSVTSLNTNDYFGSTESAPGSPSSNPSPDFPSNDGGRVKKKRSSSSAGGITKVAPIKGRRRNSAASSVGSGRRGSSSDPGASSGALWQVDIGETSVWTIVGTDQVRYNFYVPPVLFDRQSAPQTGSLPIPSKPVTPFPGVVKYLPPDRAAEAPKMHSSSSSGGIIPGAGKHDSKLLHIYGENFSKTDPIHVYFGSEPSPFVDVTCPEALRCLPPPPESHHPPGKRRPVILVRSDGVVFPTNTMYP